MVNHSIDPADWAEPVEKRNPELWFHGEIIIKFRKQELEEARKYPSGLAMWTDAFKLNQKNAGTAVCWKDKVIDRWKEKSIFLEKNKEILDAEL